jgi:hypothetical protein
MGILLHLIFFVLYLVFPSIALPGIALPRIFSAWNQNQTVDLPVPDLITHDLLHIIPRAASQDPSCPDGFLCVQELCSGDIICGEDEICVGFEGSMFCASPSFQWCAVNPTTFEGVGCNTDGVCWYV